MPASISIVNCRVHVCPFNEARVSESSVRTVPTVEVSVHGAEYSFMKSHKDQLSSLSISCSPL